MKHITLFTLLFYTAFTFAQKSEVFRLDSLPKEGVLLDKGWKWHAGDNSEWKKTTFDDSNWKVLNPSQSILQQKEMDTKRPLWLRIKLDAAYKTMALTVKQSGATSIFLNGKLIKSYGKIDPNGAHTMAFSPIGEYLLLHLDSTQNTLAVRYYFQQGIRYKGAFDASYPLFEGKLFPPDVLSNNLEPIKYFWEGFNMATGIVLFLIHFILFLFYPPTKANLWYSLSFLLGAIVAYCLLGEKMHGELYIKNQFILLALFISPLSTFLLVFTIYLLLRQTQKILLWVFSTLLALATIHYFLSKNEEGVFFNFLAAVSYVILVMYMGYNAYKNGNKGGLYVMIGMLIFIACWTVFVFNLGNANNNQIISDIFFHIANLSMPITISILLGINFGNTNRALIKNLEEINRLSTEKQQILASQNETLERQVTERTTELEQKNRDLEIEAALERVRSRTMAMQHSNELQEAATLLFQQVQALGIPAWSCGYNIWEKEEKVCTGWMSSEGFPQPSIQIPLTESPTFIRFYDSRQKGEKFYVEKVEGDTLIAHYDYMRNLPVFGEILNAFYKAGFVLPSSQIHHVVNFAHGNLIFITIEPVPEAWDIFKRFANVFEQTYTRFLDLQKAEAQAEQAKLDLILIQTEKKRAEVALTILQSTQAQLIQSEKLASLGELTAGIAHEIQNPLNFVNNFAEVSAEMLDEMHEELEKGDTTEAIAIATDLKTNLEKINHHGQRASSIVKGMLEHSRASTGVKEPTNLNALAEEYLRLAYHGLRAKDNSFNATLETHFDPDLPLVSVIPQDIGRVLLNLINNAFYAVAERSRSTVHQRTSVGVTSSHTDTMYQPTVTVSTQKIDNQILIKVKDNGNGIPESIKDKIFQPFFTTKPTGQGTGLGLSLAYDIVTKGHGGKLEVASTPNLGTTFVMTLEQV